MKHVEDLSSQLDGSRTLFVTAQRGAVGTAILFYDDKAQPGITEPDSTHVTMPFVGLPNHDLRIVFDDTPPPATLPPSGPATGDLLGNYPRPQVNPDIIPKTLPPSGPAGGVLVGTYPSPSGLAPGVIPTGLPPIGRASGVLKGSYPDPEFATQGATEGQILGIKDGEVKFFSIGTSTMPALIGTRFAVLTESPIGVKSWAVPTQDTILPSLAPVLLGPAAPELGQIVTNPTFTTSYARTPTSAILVDNQANPQLDVTGQANPTYSHTYHKTVIGSTVVFSLTAQEANQVNVVSSFVLPWLPRVFVGVGAPGGSNSAFVNALASSLQATRAKTTTVNAGSNQKIYVAVPQAYGAATISINGIQGGFLPSSVVSVTNGYGVTMNYLVYESAVAALGSTTVVVS